MVHVCNNLELWPCSSGFDSCMKYESAFPSSSSSSSSSSFFFFSSDSAHVARVYDKTGTKLKFLNVITHPKQTYGNHATSLQVINVKNNTLNNKSVTVLYIYLMPLNMKNKHPE